MQRPAIVVTCLIAVVAASCADPSGPRSPAKSLQASSSNASDMRASDSDDERDGKGRRVIRMLDDCDPATFNAALGAGTCSGNGRTTFQSFIAELSVTHAAAAWRFVPNDLEAEPGTTLIAENHGGEVHTFTHVANFGGGIVPNLNALSGNPVEAPECQNLESDDFVAPGQKYMETVSHDAVQRFQCCIHPWMRTTVRAEDEDKAKEHDRGR
jgi:plastocyanin